MDAMPDAMAEEVKLEEGQTAAMPLGEAAEEADTATDEESPSPADALAAQQALLPLVWDPNIDLSKPHALASSRPGRQWVRWTAEEHALLETLVRKLGARSWSVIASHIPGRTGKQCRERWLNHTSGDSKKGNWSHDEEYILASQHALCGSQWCRISRHLPGRNDNSVKNHWNATWRSKVMHKPQSILWLYCAELKAGKDGGQALRNALLKWEHEVPAHQVTETLGFWPSQKYGPGGDENNMVPEMLVAAAAANAAAAAAAENGAHQRSSDNSVASKAGGAEPNRDSIAGAVAQLQALSKRMSGTSSLVQAQPPGNTSPARSRGSNGVPAAPQTQTNTVTIPGLTNGDLSLMTVPAGGFQQLLLSADPGNATNAILNTSTVGADANVQQQMFLDAQGRLICRTTPTPPVMYVQQPTMLMAQVQDQQNVQQVMMGGQSVIVNGQCMQLVPSPNTGVNVASIGNLMPAPAPANQYVVLQQMPTANPQVIQVPNINTGGVQFMQMPVANNQQWQTVMQPASTTTIVQQPIGDQALTALSNQLGLQNVVNTIPTTTQFMTAGSVATSNIASTLSGLPQGSFIIPALQGLLQGSTSPATNVQNANLAVQPAVTPKTEEVQVPVAV